MKLPNIPKNEWKFDGPPKLIGSVLGIFLIILFTIDAIHMGSIISVFQYDWLLILWMILICLSVTISAGFHISNEK